MSAESHAGVKFGVLLPTREVILSGKPDPASIYDLGDQAEALGFHSVWVGDSVTAKPRLDALSTLAAVGARTRRIRLGTAVLIAALRHPVLVAHTVASLDWLSRGRVDLGIGYSRPNDPAQEHEFEVLGLSATKRIKMSEELVRIVRRLWTENAVTHQGEFFRFERVTLEPKPVQKGGVPIWLASNNVEPGLKRVARMGDGWLNNITDPRTYAECLEKIRGYAAAEGRDPGRIEPGLYVTLAVGGKEAILQGQSFLSRYYNRPYEEVARAMVCLMGSWEEVLDRIEAYREAGARTFVLRFATSDQLGHLQACAEALKQRGYLSSS
ncbi:MAG TPA: LLM class flavin-dependent oxidoreductase [candidate division Zixibacteria bacterium]|nr:LLM class flavin-dependent oxidoreductase [candidate division Zixibacteria bacterium]